jgi:hypothetical protein
MTDPKPPISLTISGGAGGTDAKLEDIELLAHHSAQLGTQLAGITAECHALLAHPDVVASALLDPTGVARFTGELLNALDGPDGLGVLAAGMEGRAAVLRTVAASYRGVDEAQAQLMDSILWLAGAMAGTELTLLVASLPLLSGPGLLATTAFASPEGGLLVAGLVGEAERVDWERLLTEHPGLIDPLIGMGPGLISGLPGPLIATDVPSAARIIGLLYPDGTAQVADKGIDTDDPSAINPPRGFHDLIDELTYRNANAKHEDQGSIDVRILTHADGTKAYIVDIPGTQDWHPNPFGHYDDKLNDLSTNLHAMGGETTAYEEGVVRALRLAGAGADDPVMLVGHSQGGIVAAQTASDLANSSEFNISHVVTAGSPIGRIDIPDGVQVLSLENAHDVVPHLDGTSNPDTANHVTVTFESPNGDIGHNHGLEDSYKPAAGVLDHSRNASLAAFRDSADTFFATKGDGTQLTTHVYQVTRG